MLEARKIRCTTYAVDCQRLLPGGDVYPRKESFVDVKNLIGHEVPNFRVQSGQHYNPHTCRVEGSQLMCILDSQFRATVGYCGAHTLQGVKKGRN